MHDRQFSSISSYLHIHQLLSDFPAMSAEQKKSKIPPNMSVGFIGAGRMAQAMARGFISTGKNTSLIVVNILCLTGVIH